MKTYHVNGNFMGLKYGDIIESDDPGWEKFEGGMVTEIKDGIESGSGSSSRRKTRKDTGRQEDAAVGGSSGSGGEGELSSGDGSAEELDRGDSGSGLAGEIPDDPGGE